MNRSEIEESNVCRSTVVKGNNTDTDYHMFKIYQFSNVFIENVNIDGKQLIDQNNGTIIVEKHCGLWMQNCIIDTNRIGINVCENARCYVKNCTFIGGSIGIRINAMANEVLITDCTFTNCGNKTKCDRKGDNGAIVIACGKESRKSTMLRARFDMKKRRNNCKSSIARLTDSNKLDIRIVNNTFTNNYGYPIVYQNFEKMDKENNNTLFSNVLKKCHIVKNTLSGFKKVGFDPNKLYVI